MRALLTSILLCLALASCGQRFDTDQRRACRLAIPALNPGDSTIVIEGSGQGPRSGILRIVYRVERPDTQPRRRTIDCIFAGEGTRLQRGALAGLASDGRPMTDASFLLLRRFYLEYKAEPPVDPEAASVAHLPSLPPGAAYLLQQALAALPSAAIYALLASAYALIYGLNGRIVLTFGEFSALGAAAAVVGVALVFSLAPSTPASGLAIAFLVAITVSAIHGFAMGRFVLRHLDKANGQQVLIATIGLAIALSEYLRLAQGVELRWLPPVFNEPLPLARAENFIVTTTPVGLAMTAAGLAAALALMRYLRRSAYGRAWRAVADDARTAALFGVDVRAVHDRALVIACAACGAAGVIVTVIYGGMGFSGGFTLGLKALVAAVLGGIGSVPGACLGGLAIAAFEMAWSTAMPLEQRDIAVYSLLAVTLILRPGGFFGDGALSPRQV
ncbi:branched-chain amino acid ABC transporter permease [Bosea sp. WAO]|uniref:branched-chain amino acid ABC transporter permease n=1 Tax=Bosea sp. WAO TaxID=406341 RepID=UPI00083391C2|nr:branched-chain amino acid ABC transporter permease [Bosea sp. WAO]